MSLVFSQNKVLLHLYSLLRIKRDFQSAGDNYLEKHNLLFIHNPKVAGNSLSRIFSGSEKKLNTSHKIPTFLVRPREWERCTSIVAVRHPIDRLISSYHYHTKSSYTGIFHRKYPNLPQLSLEGYFDLFSKEPYVIMPQNLYSRHLLSDKPADYILKFESLEEDVLKLCEEMQLDFDALPHLNSSARSSSLNYFQSKSLREKVLTYYEEDFHELGYSPEFDRY